MKAAEVVKQLIEQNLNAINARVAHVLSKGHQLPVALIYQTDSPVGKKIAKIAGVEDRVQLHLANRWSSAELAWHIIVGNALSIADLFADAIDGTTAHIPTIDQMVELICKPPPGEYPILATVATDGGDGNVFAVYTHPLPPPKADGLLPEDLPPHFMN